MGSLSKLYKPFLHMFGESAYRGILFFTAFGLSAYIFVTDDAMTSSELMSLTRLPLITRLEPALDLHLLPSFDLESVADIFSDVVFDPMSTEGYVDKKSHTIFTCRPKMGLNSPAYLYSSTSKHGDESIHIFSVYNTTQPSMQQISGQRTNRIYNKKTGSQAYKCYLGNGASFDCKSYRDCIREWFM